MIPASFHFLRPAWLFALLALLPIGWVFLRRARAAGGWERVCDPHLLRHLVAQGGGRAARWPLALLALGWLGACLALAGPTFERLPQLSFKEPSRSVFVLGLGNSMNQRDVRPSRLARARHKLLDALDRADGSVALVVYKEEGFAVTPLTDDADVLRELIPLLETHLMPGRAVFAARGIEEARKLLLPAGLHGARIVLLSDGADSDPQATLAAVREVAAQGAQVSVVSLVGESAPLAELAQQGGGAFAPLAIDDADLDRVFAAGAGADALRAPALGRSEAMTDEWDDLGAWLTWIPLVLAPFAFRRGWAGAALVLLVWQVSPEASRADVLDAFTRPDQRGARAFAEGRFEESAQHFEDPAWQAAARYRSGDFAGAAQLLSALPDAEAQYNLGNALAKGGELEQAVAAYERALAAKPEDEDARYNRDLVKKLLEQQKQAQQPQGQGQQQEGDQGEQPQDSAQAQDGEQAESQAGGAQQEEGEPASQQEAAPQPSQGDAADSQPSDAEAQLQDAGAPEPSEQADAQGAAPERGAPTASAAPMSPEEQARAQLLSRLPDDPGGLLREKMRRDYLRKQAERRGEER